MGRHGNRSLFAVVAVFLMLEPVGSAANGQGMTTAVRAEGGDAYSVTPDVRRWSLSERLSFLGATRAANAAESRGNYREAEDHWRAAITVAEATWGPDHPVASLGVNNLALNLQHQGRFSEAEPLLRRALRIDEARLGAEHASTATTLDNLAANLNEQDREGEAEPLHRRALAIYESRIGPDTQEAATSLNNLALNLDAQRRYAEAEPLYRRSLEILEARLSDNHRLVAGSINNLARNLTNQNRSAEAETLYRRALVLAERRLGPEHPAVATMLSNLASNLSAQRRFGDAEAVYRRALAIREERLGTGHPETVRSQLSVSLGSLRANRPDDALPLARAALQTRAALLDGLGGSADSQVGFTGRAGWAAQLVVTAAWGAAQQPSADALSLRAEAFAAAQSVRASSSARALTEGAARIAAEGGGAGEAVRTWRAAQDRIAALDAEIAAAAQRGAAGDTGRTRLSVERAAASAELSRAEKDLASQFPRYFELVRSPPVSLADLQAPDASTASLLRADEALLLLTPGDMRLPEGRRNGLVFVVTQTTSAWAEIPLTPQDLAREVAATHANLARAVVGDPDAALAPFDRARAHRLYRALFGAPEIASALAGKDRWLVAPQGALMSLPFSALVMQPPAGGVSGDADPNRLRETQWLGLTRTLAVLPSVSALRLQRTGGEKSLAERTLFFGLGDPAFAGVADAGAPQGGLVGAAQSYFRGAAADLARLAALPRLPATAVEIRALAQSFGVGRDSYVLQLEATEAELRRRNASGVLGQAEIIALATHALLAGDLPGLAEPALVLTPPVLAGTQTAAMAENDGLLTASEAATLTLSARMVILSACNTAAGGAPDADALSGLARAFFYAGAQSLLVSHYAVFDDAAQRLTVQAARVSRAEGLRTPEAMRRSMQALMADASADASGRSFAHPAVWAPFAVVDAN